MRWLKLTVAYDGTDYAGWQWQPNDPTVQGKLRQAWHSITGEEQKLPGSGRTDAGVHAWGQVFSAETATTIVTEQIPRALNAKLPDDIVVLAAEEAPVGFHATYDALRKTYRYQIHNSRIRPLFDRDFLWHIPTRPLDVEAMRVGGQYLLGRHDFAAFESTGSERATTVRTILDLRVEQHDAPNSKLKGERIDITVTGDGFLYNMVRTIAGTLVEVGRRNFEPSWIGEVIASRDRNQAGMTAPAQGLVLMSVEY